VVQAEGLKEVARKRRWRLARDAVRAWMERVRLAREARAAEERLLNALKRVRVGVRPRPTGPFRGPDALALSPAPVSPLPLLLTAEMQRSRRPADATQTR